MDTKLLSEAKERVNQPKKKPFPFWGFLYAMASLMFALYVYFNQGFLSASILSDKLSFITETVIAGALGLFSAIKLIGISKQWGTWKRLGIIGLSGCWVALASLTTMFALGVGYPSPNFILYWMIAVACLRISRKGDFY